MRAIRVSVFPHGATRTARFLYIIVPAAAAAATAALGAAVNYSPARRNSTAGLVLAYLRLQARSEESNNYIYTTSLDSNCQRMTTTGFSEEAVDICLK